MTQTKGSKPLFISFVTPVLNEELNVEELYCRIRTTAESIATDFELICVDDGSTDGTLNKLRALHENDPRLKIISFSRNFGHQLAVTAGLHHATGDCVAILDGDLQDPPEVVERLVNKWREGFPVVYAIRKKRKEWWFKRLCYNMFYRLLKKMARVDIPLDAGDFCLLDNLVVQRMRELNEFNPFVRGLRAWLGFDQAGVEYERPARKLGETKYSYWKLARLAFHGIISFSDVLLNSAAIIGVVISILSALYGVWIALNRILIAAGIFGEENLVPGFTTLICFLTFLMGLIFIYLGILGKYIGYIFMQSKGRPLYITKEVRGFDLKE